MERIEDFSLYDMDGINPALVREIEEIKHEIFMLDMQNYNKNYKEELKQILINRLAEIKTQVGNILLIET